MARQMRAVRITALGEPVEDSHVLIPDPGDDEVRVRVRAAGICHSDEHYRSGKAPPGHLPITPGHEVSGVIEAVGAGVDEKRIGQRVALHYLLTCGRCIPCSRGDEQFCEKALMLGKYVDGGWAEYICVPARNAVPIPDALDFSSAAVMMCSTSTAYHALKKARLGSGESVAVFGLGGLGQSAVQLAGLMGASRIFAVDVNRDRLDLAASRGAIPIEGGTTTVVDRIQSLSGGVDVALELIGLPATISQAVECLAPKGRAAIAGICPDTVGIDTYRFIVGREAELIGVSDHLLAELYELVKLSPRLDFGHIVTELVPLEAASINRVLERLGAFGSGVRSVIEP